MLRVAGIALVAVALTVPVVLDASLGKAPGRCPSDSKLLNGGPTAVDGDGDGSFWGLIMDGLLAAGFDTPQKQIAYLNQIFATDFGDLPSIKAYNLQLISDAWDANGNGYVCAFDLRGRRAHFNDPYVNLTYFGISDDRIGK